MGVYASEHRVTPDLCIPHLVASLEQEWVAKV